MEISRFHANNVDPDQTPHSAASDLGLHCLPVPLFWDTMHKKWVTFNNDIKQKLLCKSINEVSQEKPPSRNTVSPEHRQEIKL